MYIHTYIYVCIYLYLHLCLKVVLLICPTFRYATLCERIEHYTARIDYNQDLFIYIYIYVYIKCRFQKEKGKLVI